MVEPSQAAHHSDGTLQPIAWYRQTFTLLIVSSLCGFAILEWPSADRAGAAATGLVAAYGFNEGTGTSTADSSGNLNTGTVNKAAWTSTAKFGKALTFSGTSSVSVASAPSLDLGAEMTLEAWVRPTNLTGWRPVIVRELTGALAYALYANDNIARPSGWFRTGGVSRSAVGSAALAINTWSHVATTYDGAVLRLYVNGIQTGSRAVTGPITTSTQPLRLGGDVVSSQYFKGQIDEVRVYNRALTASEIQADMVTPVPPPPDTTAPTVTVTAPVTGAVVSGSLSVSATASDNLGVAGVQFLLDNSPLGGEVTSGPYSVTWDTTIIPNGPHTLGARARDAAGNVGLAPTVSVSVNNDTTPPVIGAVTTSNVAQDSATISWTTDEPSNSQVEYGTSVAYGSSTPINPTLTTAHGVSLSGLTGSADYHYRVVSRDAAGNLARSGDFTFSTPAPDVIPPAVSIVNPSNGAVVGGSLTAMVDASDNVAVAGVTLLVDDAPIGAEASTAPYSIMWNTTSSPNGAHTLTARARDAAGNVATSAPVSVSVSNADTTPPTVTITAPANNATVSGSAVTVTASASDNVTVAGVQFKLDGVSVWVEDTLPPYSVSWDTATISNGPHTLTATARDGSGNTATSTAVIVTVSNATGKSLTIDGAQVFQTIDGFGVNANSLSWNNGELKPAIDMLVDQMGATIWRVVFDMEDWETPNDNADPNTFEPTYYTALYSNAKFKNLWGTIGYLNQKGIDSNLVISFMGRVPVWMGGDHIDSTLGDEWVETIASLVNYGRAVQGVRFGALDPINEPDWDGIEGPRVDEFQYTRLLRKLSLRFDSLGDSDLKLIGPNTASIDTGVNTSSSTFFFASAAANVTRYNIGRSVNLPSESFAGVIDELRIYNRPLTQAEIQADMNTPIAALLPAADPAGAAPTRTFMQRVERSLREVGETISNAERAERSLTMRFSDSRRAQRARR